MRNDSTSRGATTSWRALDGVVKNAETSHIHIPENQPSTIERKSSVKYERERIIDKEVARERERTLWFVRLTVKRPFAVMVRLLGR